MPNNASDDASDDDARAENASLMEELRSRLLKAETASEEYQRQLNMLQANLDDSLLEHGKLEDQLHENAARIEDLEAERVQRARQKREMEDSFELERTAMAQDIAEQKVKEEEQQAVVKRLKETLTQREIRISMDEDKGLPRSRKSTCASIRERNGNNKFQRAFETGCLQILRMATLRHPRLSSGVIRRTTQHW